MKTRLRYLPLSDVREGMVLGAPLMLSEHGVTNFSLAAGHELTESNIRQIALRHGEFACIQEIDPRSDAERAADLAHVTERLERIFRNADRSHHDKAVAGLYRAVLAFRSQ